MALTNKGTLKTAVDDWMARSDISGSADDRIQLAEARLNRELGEVLTSQSLTGTISSREISVLSYSVAKPIALYLAESGLDEVELKKQMDGTFPYSVTTNRPSAWAYVDGVTAGASTAKIVLDCPLDAAYPFRFKFRQRFSLSADADTNWLLLYHPDIYLAAAIAWGGFYTQDNSRMTNFAALLEQGIPSVKAYISAQNRGQLNVDSALVSQGRWWNFTSGE